MWQSFLGKRRSGVLESWKPRATQGSESKAVTIPSYHEWLRGALPSTWTAEADHIRLISEHLDAVSRGDIDRLAIHMPPRHGKTEMVTVRFPIYSLESDPTMPILVTGYNERFARRLGRKTRNLALDRGLAVQSDKRAEDEWQLSQGGMLMARGVGSPPTGVGFRRIVIDDPIRSREHADSEVYRERVWDWYTDDLYTRLEPGGAIVLVMTLWHHDDLGARAVASEPGRWTVLKLPAISESGAALWPERWPIEDLERRRQVLRRTDGERSWEALYQQNPTPAEGATFKVSQLGIEDALPAHLPVVRAWDAAATSGKGDWSVGVKMAGPDRDGRYWVVHVERGQWDSSERDRTMRLTSEIDGAGCRVFVPQDPGSAGKSLAEHWIRLLAGFDVSASTVTGDKETRASPFAAQLNAGNVRLLRGTWNGAFVEELRQFPAGKHDDQVDAASDAFRILASMQTMRRNDEMWRKWRAG